MLKMNQDSIRGLSLEEIELVAGGRSETKDGKTCTDPRTGTKGGTKAASYVSVR
jgi:hypothetical protein